MKGKSIFLALGLSLTMGLGAAAALHGVKEIKRAEAEASTVYLKPGVWNSTGNPVFAAYVWGGSGDHWYQMTQYATNTDYFKASIDTTLYPNVIFTRLKPSTADGYKNNNGGLNFDNAWNQTGDLTFDQNCYSVTGWSTGAWETYDGSPAVHTYSLVGTMDSWNAADTTYDMNIEGNTATYANLELSAGAELKILRDHSFDVTYGYTHLDGSSDDYFSAGENNNMVALADGTYSFSFDITQSEISVTFVPTAVTYSVKVAGGSYNEMLSAGTFDYEDGEHNPHTGYIYTFDITATEGQKLFFKRNATEIHPGASDGDLTNNLFWRSSNQEITVLQDVDSETLTLKVYHDGYDTFLDGYVSAPVTYYFSNNQGWEGAPRYYAYDANGKELKSWEQSDEMTYVDSNSDNDRRYSFSLDIVKFPNLIISNNARDDQTVVLTPASYMVQGLYLNERDAGQENHWTVSTYDFAPAARKINVGGVPYDLEPSAVQPVEAGLLVQLESGNIDMTAGDQVTYRVDGTAIDSAVLQAYGRNNGKIVDGKKQVLASVTAKVYVKLYDNGAISIMVMGIDELSAGYHVFLNDNEVVELVDSGEIPDGFTGQTCSEAVTFHQNDKFKLVDTSSNSALPVVFTAGGGLDPASNENFELQDGYIKYKGTEDFEAKIYLKLKSGADVVYVEMADQNMVKARNFASAFNTAINAVCKWDGSTVQSDLETAWAAQATIYKGGTLTDDARNILKADTDSHVVEIEAFKAKYESVLRLRKLASGWDLEDFMNKNYSSNSIRIVNPTNNNALIITLISITVVTVGAVAVYMTIKRRKHE